MLSKFKLNQLYFKDTQFANLMTRRIFNVLLIANPYDAFMLEDDGRIDERYSMNTLRSPCATSRFTQVSTCRGADTAGPPSLFGPHHLQCRARGDNDSFDVGTIHQKTLYEQIPMVILPLSATASPSVLPMKTSVPLSMCSAGWETPTCWFPSSS